MNTAIETVATDPSRDLRGHRINLVRLTIVACAAFLLIIVAIPASMGAFPWMFPGFAKEDALQAIIMDSHKHWAYQAQDSIMQLRAQECKIPSGETRDTYLKMIQNRMSDYYDLTGQGFQLPSCTDL